MNSDRIMLDLNDFNGLKLVLLLRLICEIVESLNGKLRFESLIIDRECSLVRIVNLNESDQISLDLNNFNDLKLVLLICEIVDSLNCKLRFKSLMMINCECILV